MTKKELSKIKIGGFILIEWLDSPPTVAVLLEKIDPKIKGDISISCLYANGDINNHAIHSQILKVFPHMPITSQIKELEKLA